MATMWNSPMHNWCAIEFAHMGEGVFVQIWRGPDKKGPSQTYNLHFFTGDVPLSGQEHLLRAMHLAMGEFNQRDKFNEPIVELADDGTINPWKGELFEPEK